MSASEEYFQFYAFYNNNADPGMQTRRGNTAPMLEIVKVSEPAQREAGIKVETVEELVDKLKNEAGVI